MGIEEYIENVSNIIEMASIAPLGNNIIQLDRKNLDTLSYAICMWIFNKQRDNKS